MAIYRTFFFFYVHSPGSFGTHVIVENQTLWTIYSRSPHMAIHRTFFFFYVHSLGSFGTHVIVENQTLCNFLPWAKVPWAKVGSGAQPAHLLPITPCGAFGLEGVDPEFPLEQKRVIGSLLEIFSELGSSGLHAG